MLNSRPMAGWAKGDFPPPPKTNPHGGLVEGRLALLPEAEPPVRVLTGAAAPRLVHERHVRDQPAGAELDQGERQPRVALGNTAADQVGHDLRRGAGGGVGAAL